MYMLYVHIYLDAARPHQPVHDKNEDQHYAYRKDYSGQEELHHRQAPVRNPMNVLATFKSTFTTENKVCILVHSVGTYSKSRLTTESKNSLSPMKTPARLCGRGHTVAVLTNLPRKSAPLDIIRLLACFQGRNSPLCTACSLSWLR